MILYARGFLNSQQINIINAFWQKVDDLVSAALPVCVIDISKYFIMAGSKLFNRIQSPFHGLSGKAPS